MLSELTFKVDARSDIFMSWYLDLPIDNITTPFLH